MGWLSSSPAPSSSPQTPPNHNQQQNSAQPPPPPPPQSAPEPTAPDTISAPPQPPSTTSPHPSKPPRKPTRDELADAELEALLSELSSSSPPSSTSTSSLNPFTSLLFPSSSHSPSSSFSSPPTKSPASLKNQTEKTASPSPIGSDIYPSSFSCTSFFDLAYHCQLPGGQFINVYRYGELRDCSSIWKDFWFCMRVNRGYMSQEERGEKVRGFYRGKEERLLRGGSSEDVWRARGPGEGVREGVFGVEGGR